MFRVHLEKGVAVDGHLFIFAIGGDVEEDDDIHVEVKTVMEEL